MLIELDRSFEGDMGRDRLGEEKKHNADVASNRCYQQPSPRQMGLFHLPKVPLD